MRWAIRTLASILIAGLAAMLIYSCPLWRWPVDQFFAAFAGGAFVVIAAGAVIFIRMVWRPET